MRWERLPTDYPDVVALTLYGEPVSKARPRAQPDGGRSYTPAKTREAEELWQQAIRLTHRGLRPDAEHWFAVSVVFYLGTWRARDVDNMLKLVLDAGNGLVYKDDSQVIDVRCRTVYASDAPRTELVISHDLLETRPKPTRR